MRPEITFLNPQIFLFSDKDFVIPLEVIYPDWDNLSRFGDIVCSHGTVFPSNWLELYPSLEYNSRDLSISPRL